MHFWEENVPRELFGINSSVDLKNLEIFGKNQEASYLESIPAMD